MLVRTILERGGNGWRVLGDTSARACSCIGSERIAAWQHDNDGDQRDQPQQLVHRGYEHAVQPNPDRGCCQRVAAADSASRVAFPITAVRGR